MAVFPIRLDTAGGEYMESVVVTEWHRMPGDEVRQGALLVTVETAKAATEIEAERDGWLVGIFAPVGTEVALGGTLGYLADTKDERPPQEDATGADADPPAAPDVTRPATAARIVASPLARRLARGRGLALEGIAGTGPGGRIKARDLPAAERTRAGDAAVPLVLLHGFGADRTAWHGLRAILPGPVVALDLAGHGKRGSKPAENLFDLAADIAAQLDALGIEDMHLAGHSLGGAVALELTGLARQSVRSLSLLAPAGLGAPVSRSFTSALLSARTPEELETILKEAFADPARLPAGLASATLACLDTGKSRETLARLEHALFADAHVLDRRALLARLPMPLRIVWGAEDRIIPPAMAAALPGTAALHLLPGVGHIPQIEAPALTARLLAETVRSAP